MSKEVIGRNKGINTSRDVTEGNEIHDESREVTGPNGGTQEV